MQYDKNGITELIKRGWTIQYKAGLFEVLFKILLLLWKKKSLAFNPKKVQIV